MQRGDDVLGLGLFLHQDMAGFVFVAEVALEAFVLGFQSVVVDWVVLHKILYICIGQDGLAAQLDLLGDLGRFVQSFLDRLLSRQCLQDQLVDNAFSHAWAVGLAGAGILIGDQVDTAFADGDTVDRCLDGGFHRRRSGFHLLVRVAGAKNQQRYCAGQEDSGVYHDHLQFLEG